MIFSLFLLKYSKDLKLNPLAMNEDDRYMRSSTHPQFQEFMNHIIRNVEVKHNNMTTQALQIYNLVKRNIQTSDDIYNLLLKTNQNYHPVKKNIKKPEE